MKPQIAVLILVVAAVSAKRGRQHGQHQEEFQKIIKKCQEELSITDEQMKQHMENGWTSEAENFDCLEKCMMTGEGRMKMMEDDGTLVLPEKMESNEDLQKCFKENDVENTADICKKAKKVKKCMKEMMKNHPHRRGPPRPSEVSEDD